MLFLFFYISLYVALDPVMTIMSELDFRLGNVLSSASQEIAMNVYHDSYMAQSILNEFEPIKSSLLKEYQPMVEHVLNHEKKNALGLDKRVRFLIRDNDDSLLQPMLNQHLINS
jgi:hypothetical protein